MILKRQMESMKVTRWISIWMVWISFLVVIGYGSGGGGGDDSGGGSGSNAGSGLQLGSYSMGFTADQNGPAPSTQSITVTVTAPDATYLYAGYPPLIPIPTWLDMAIAGSDSPFSLDLSVNSTSMPVGTHSTTVRVLCARSDDTVNGYREISVPCTITNELTVSQQTPGYSCINGASSTPPDRTISIGGQGFAWSATVDQGWFQLGSTSGTSPSSLIVGVNPTGLWTGAHAAVLTLSDGTTSLTVDINLTITASSFSVTPSSLVLGGTSGLDLSAQPLQFSLSTGTNSYPWTVTLTTDSDGSWLLVDATSGMISAASASINVDADHTALNHNSKKRWNYPGGMGSMMLSHSPSSSPHQLYTSGLAKWRHAVGEHAV